MWPPSGLLQQLVKTDGRLPKHAPDVSSLRVAREADFRDGVMHLAETDAVRMEQRKRP
jgi:hypothetical protein